MRATTGLVLLLLSPGCSGDASVRRRHLEATGFVGEISRVDPSGCGASRTTVTLYGPALSTEGPVTARVPEDTGRPTWLYFPIQTALGSAEAALRLQGDEAMLPLGARAGELDVHLSMADGPLDPAESTAAAARAAAELERARAAWGDGRFRLVDPNLPGDDGLVGELVFRPDGPALVGVYDRYWWSGGLVAADRIDEGPDIVLVFVAEPAIQGEEALLRVNVPTSTAVVPADRQPTEMDRHLRLEPGVVTEAERAAAMERARAASIAEERATLEKLGSRVAERSLRADGTCASLDSQPPALRDLFVGYDVEVVAEDGRCFVEVEPVRRQHRRRVAARIGPDGIVDLATGR